MFRLLTTLVFLLASLAAAQETPEPTLNQSFLPQYPEFANRARLEGSVKLEFRLTESGEVAGVHVLSGQSALSAYAFDVVRLWRFSIPPELRSKLGSPQPPHFVTEFVYRLSGKVVDRQPLVTVTFASYRRVEIVSEALKSNAIHVPQRQ